MVVVDDILAEVEDDLAHGDHASARRRLREALVTRPHRLDLRVRLAAVYRDLGDLPQAGRWGYLAEDAPAEEVRAFRIACGEDPSLMLEALAWGEDDDGEEEDEGQITATAWERIATLRREMAASRKADGGSGSKRAGSLPAAPYPFTPPTGITRPVVPAKKPARMRERIGLALIMVGLLAVLSFLVLIGGGVIWMIFQFVQDTYQS